MNRVTVDRRLLAHQLLRAAILAGFAFLIVQLDRSGNLTLYIAPRMSIYVKLSALGLYATAVYQLYAALQTWIGRRASDCGCDHAPSPSLIKNMLIYGLFLLPLLLGFLLPDTLMGSTLAAKKGMSLGGSESISRQVPAPQQPVTPPPAAEKPSTEPAAPLDPLDAMFPADIYTESYARHAKKLYGQELIEVPEKQFIETLTTLDLYREHYVGKTIRISGFVYRDGATPEGQFVVSRFAMNCCSADSMPYGLMIRSDEAAKYANDSWLEVTGTLGLTHHGDQEIMILQATGAIPIEPSDTPYVYPDYDFGLD
ncbi:TIGR03943 family protein [Paenibacillus sp. 598K]|uniref:TIGR03943 family putative permease subunit n=1 Tax=Paenibacillus sp. 598K TaxID=1117987 RepID=UPI000FF92F59|nr:TIGR03943 family protein [Paenibacillus sp. 598K]GBF73331.1 TIGR03943 family protein [Paenibacillus sp. 598K]